ncbi:MAG: glycosyltransferase family 2 protein [Candidatus Gygaella obscura]|nr:glycosyltransferase family 2 protein [Candidatus Gygaella obscura]
MDRYDNVSIIIAFKEENDSIKQVVNGLDGFNSEKILIGKGFSKETLMFLQSKGAKVHIVDDRGKGHALRIGAKIATRDILLFIDADGSHIPSEIPSLVSPILENKVSLVVASRVLGHSEEYHNNTIEKIRLFGNVIATGIINFRWSIRLTDSQNGFRAIKRNVFQKLDLREDEFAIEQEMIMKCLRMKEKVLEVPSHELRRVSGCSKLNTITMLPKYIFCLIKNII